MQRIFAPQRGATRAFIAGFAVSSLLLLAVTLGLHLAA